MKKILCISWGIFQLALVLLIIGMLPFEEIYWDAPKIVLMLFTLGIAAITGIYLLYNELKIKS